MISVFSENPGDPMPKLVKLIKLNNLQYNANRDPQFYRRLPEEEFRIQALLGGSGTARGSFVVDGKPLCESDVRLPGSFDCRVRFDSPGVRVGTLTIEANGETFRQDLRLDVLERPWIG